VIIDGDVDDNGVMNAIDAVLTLQFTAGLLDDLEGLSAADVNHNGTVNAIDAAIILQRIAGLL